MDKDIEKINEFFDELNEKIEQVCDQAKKAVEDAKKIIKKGTILLVSFLHKKTPVQKCRGVFV